MALLLPLTIITGFYGMNVHLPFQENNQAYLGILFAMFLSSVIMVYLSIKQGWIARIKIKSLSE
jgi:Mg2+ and Co2+ transporter CorA